MSRVFQIFIIVLPAKMEKHTDNKLFASFEPEVPTHLYKEVLGIKI